MSVHGRVPHWFEEDGPGRREGQETKTGEAPAPAATGQKAKGQQLRQGGRGWAAAKAGAGPDAAGGPGHYGVHYQAQGKVGLAEEVSEFRW